MNREELKNNSQQLIVTAKPLPNHDDPEAIQYAWALLDFTILTKYVLYDKERLYYIEHVLYI